MNFPVFTQLAGNFRFPETGSLETASSCGESANFPSLARCRDPNVPFGPAPGEDLGHQGENSPKCKWQRYKPRARCVRMIRADYCGDGRANTRDGTRTEFYDRLGVTRPEPAEGMSFEAAWVPGGAVCVAHVRVTDFATLDGLAQDCPERLAGRIGPVCQEEAAIRLGGLTNRDSRRRADVK